MKEELLLLQKKQENMKFEPWSIDVTKRGTAAARKNRRKRCPAEETAPTSSLTLSLEAPFHGSISRAPCAYRMNDQEHAGEPYIQMVSQNIIIWFTQYPFNMDHYTTSFQNESLHKNISKWIIKQHHLKMNHYTTFFSK